MGQALDVLESGKASVARVSAGPGAPGGDCKQDKGFAASRETGRGGSGVQKAGEAESERKMALH